MAEITPINWEDKVNSPELLAFLQQYGKKHYLSAEEINQLRDIINLLIVNRPIDNSDKLDRGGYIGTAQDIVNSMHDPVDISGKLDKGGYIGTANTLKDAVTLLAKNYTDDVAILKENLSNKAVDFNTINDTLYPTIKSVKIQLDTKIPATEKGIANGVASLGADGKIPNSQIPALAISETFPVTSQAAMLALNQAEQGDVAVRLDLSKSFILRVSPSSVLENWQELLTPSDAVQSINGQVGNVNLTTSHIPDSSNKRYQTDNQKLFNDATSSIQTQLNSKVSDDNAVHKNGNIAEIITGIKTINSGTGRLVLISDANSQVFSSEVTGGGLQSPSFGSNNATEALVVYNISNGDALRVFSNGTGSAVVASSSPSKFTYIGKNSMIDTTFSVSGLGNIIGNGLNLTGETANTIASFDGSKNIKSLSTTTYPTLSELAFVKGVTSSIQSQLNGKQNTITNPVTGTGTVNRISKWTSSNSQSNGQMTDNGVAIDITTSDARFRGGDTTGRLIVGNSATTAYLVLNGDTNVAPNEIQLITATGIIRAFTNSIERFTILNNGKVGINTPAPTTIFHIVDTNGGLFFDGTNATYNRFKSTNVAPGTSKDFLISTQVSGTTPDLYINTSGAIGSGTNTPMNNLGVSVASANKGISLQNVAGSAEYARFGVLNVGTNNDSYIGSMTNNRFLIYANGSEKVRVHPSGGVSFGNTTDPGANNIDVTGGIKAASFALQALNTTPASATATGTIGEIRFDANFMYLCTATNTWKKSPLTTW